MAIVWGLGIATANGTVWFTVHILAPVLGGLLGGWIYHVLLKDNYEAHEKAAGKLRPSLRLN